VVLTASLALASLEIHAQLIEDPHGDPATGVLRVITDPPTRGECLQCHPAHGGSWVTTPFPKILFTDNTNQLAYWDGGERPCHRGRPDNYPLDETDRLPETVDDPGYFESNVGGERRRGVEYRGRWPGESVYADPTVTLEGHYTSPHAQDPDMPRRDAFGEGLCLNCHDPHATPGQRDLLLVSYHGIGGSGAVTAPAEYSLCFSCHGAFGPPDMDPPNRLIADFYDPGLNGESAGHQIRKNPQIALSWPGYVQVGDMLPCYDCHNPHGSEGYNGTEANAYTISDQRPGWSGLTDPAADAAQSRRFCTGCHIAADGIPGSVTVEGIVMNTISDRDGHRSLDAQSCHDCHGRDYTGPTGRNVHNPE
jgi:hypothetical protein